MEAGDKFDGKLNCVCTGKDVAGVGVGVGVGIGVGVGVGVSVGIGVGVGSRCICGTIGFLACFNSFFRPS